MTGSENGERGSENGVRIVEPVHDPHEGGPPPIGGTWVRLYVIVLGELALLVALFYWFRRVFE